MTTRIIGTGSAIPSRVVTNQELETFLDTSDTWIQERTGIGSRHAATTETTTSLAAEACRKALENAGKKAEEVDLILAATVSPDCTFPCLACEIQAAIGADNATAYDLNAACAGFLFALNSADAYIRCGMYRNALIVGAEVLTKIVDWNDRSSCILFGDGAGAAFVQAEEEGVVAMVQGANGKKGMALYRYEGQVNTPFREAAATAEESKGSGYLEMNGQEVFRFAVSQVPDSIQKVLEKAGWDKSEVDHYILHQANARIIQSIAKRLGEPEEKFPMNLHHYGNMSSASIPVLLDELNQAGKLKRGEKIIMSGFGAGLTYGATAVIW
ncbi:MAG: ketoacyl-ACP synthase III [Bacteroides sp.]|nr:ketoacyl-ACP synthase III [Bacteroides sp.]MCM1550091.1 ketoacyl-ACP synthase III [Clostridium sp.]